MLICACRIPSCTFSDPHWTWSWIPDWLVITAVSPGVVVDQMPSSVLYYLMIPISLVHNLPALIEDPSKFYVSKISFLPFSSISVQYLVFNPADHVKFQQHLRYQMSNILHSLSSTFTTCACGTRAQDCTIN
jgi:hypothetical protein